MPGDQCRAAALPSNPAVRFFARRTAGVAAMNKRALTRSGVPCRSGAYIALWCGAYQMMESDPAVRVRQDIDKLIEQLKPEHRRLLRDMSESELIRLHMGYGTRLRNQFRQNEFPHFFKFCSAKIASENLSFDAISAVAIREIWLHVRSSRPLQPT
jgi:hypothetical protein